MAETRKYKEGQTDKEPVTETEENAGEDLRSPAERALAKREEEELPGKDEADADAEQEQGTDEEGDEAVLPAQMGHRRYVYAVYFALGIALAYFLSKAGLALWHRLSQWTPK